MSMQRSVAWVLARLAHAGATVDLLHEGYSMAPCLRPGDRLTVAGLGVAGMGGRAEPGAVLLAARGERLVAHRLVRWAGDTVVLRGDANSGDDGAVASELVVGEVISARRGGRAVSLRRSRARVLLAAARAWLQP